MIHANRSTLKVFQAVFALSSFVLAVATPAATIYKWTDQRGETHYSDKKPAGNQWEIVDESKKVSDMATSVFKDISAPLAAQFKTAVATAPKAAPTMKKAA